MPEIDLESWLKATQANAAATAGPVSQVPEPTPTGLPFLYPVTAGRAQEDPTMLSLVLPQTPGRLIADIQRAGN